MLTPSEDVIQGYLVTLQQLRQSLSPSNEVTKTMLADALRGEYSQGLHGEVQVKLLLLHVAQTREKPPQNERGPYTQVLGIETKLRSAEALARFERVHCRTQIEQAIATLLTYQNLN